MTDLPRSTLQQALQMAALAPSAHNTQPWQVTVRGRRVLLGVDPKRTLPHTDPASRDLDLALGAFAEAFHIGLRSVGGEATEVDAPANCWAAFDLAVGVTDRSTDLSLLRQRQTSRLAYSPRPLDVGVLTQLERAARGVGLELHVAPRGSAEHTAWRELLFAASRESWLDVRAIQELGLWVRPDFEGLRSPSDGLSTHCLGLGSAEALGLMAALRPRAWQALSRVYAANTVAERLAQEDVVALDGSPAFALLTASEPTSRVGGALLRFWLACTRLHVAVHPQSVLLDRRGWEVGKRLGVDPRRVRLAIRLGHSAPPPRSGRRPVEQFAAFE